MIDLASFTTPSPLDSMAYKHVFCVQCHAYTCTYAPVCAVWVSGQFCPPDGVVSALQQHYGVDTPQTIEDLGLSTFGQKLNREVSKLSRYSSITRM